MLKIVQTVHTYWPRPLDGAGTASMLSIVEVGLFGGDVGAAMTDMRTWLEQPHLRPVMFRQVRADNGPIFFLEFAKEGEALAFLNAFDGRRSVQNPKLPPPNPVGLPGRLKSSVTAHEGPEIELLADEFRAVCRAGS